MSTVRRVNSIKSRLLDSMAELLQVPVEQLDASASFLSQGADSIVLLEAVRRIESEYGVTLEMQRFFEELDSVDALSHYLAEHAEPAAEPASNDATAATDRSGPVEPPPRSAVAAGALPNGAVALFQAQVQLIRTTIEQQNRFLLEASSNRVE